MSCIFRAENSLLLGREADDRLESVTKGTIYCSPTLLKTSFEKGYRKSNVGVFVRRFLGFARRSRNWPASGERHEAELAHEVELARLQLAELASLESLPRPSPGRTGAGVVFDGTVH